MRALVLVPAMLLLVAGTSFAQSQNTENTLKLDKPGTSPPATIDQMAWLAGSWEGDSSLGWCQEHWMTPNHGSMAGVFKAVRNGELFFYEFVEITEENGSLVMKVKHFDPDLKGWEEREEFVSFPLVKLEPNTAYFSGLTYRREGDRLRAFVATEDDGKVHEMQFSFEAPQSE